MSKQAETNQTRTQKVSYHGNVFLKNYESNLNECKNETFNNENNKVTFQQWRVAYVSNDVSKNGDQKHLPY